MSGNPDKDLKAYKEWRERIDNPGFLSSIVGESSNDSMYARAHPTEGAKRHMAYLAQRRAQMEADDKARQAGYDALAKRTTDFSSTSQSFFSKTERAREPLSLDLSSTPPNPLTSSFLNSSTPNSLPFSSSLTGPVPCWNSTPTSSFPSLSSDYKPF